MKSPALNPQIVVEATRWMAKLWADPGSEELKQCCTNWRAADPDHELAWQRLQNLDGKFATLPSHITPNTLLNTSPQSRRNTLKSIGAIFALGGLAYASGRSNLWDETFADHKTAVGEMRSWKLADGTQVWLNTHSRMDVVFTERERSIQLYSGEVLIATGADPRPLLVKTQQGSVRPIGTRFSVRELDGQSHVAVYVGAVELRTAETNRFLRLDAGSRAAFSAEQVFPVTASSMDDLGWIQGMLVAERMRVEDVIAELARYRTGTIHCDPAIANLRVTGVFSLKDTDRALTNLAQSLQLELVYTTRYWVSLHPRTQ